VELLEELPVILGPIRKRNELVIRTDLEDGPKLLQQLGFQSSFLVLRILAYRIVLKRSPSAS